MEEQNIKILPEGFNQYDLNFKIILVGDSGNIKQNKRKKLIQKFK
jgi:hypothetical protein